MPPTAPTPLKFAVAIDGTVVAAYNAVGGLPRADVSTMFSGAGGPPKRHISSFAYTNLAFQLGLDVGTPILNWINAALKGAPVTKSGTLIELDLQNRAKSYLDFTNASIADFVVPGFDGSSKTPNMFNLEAAISKSTFRTGDNAPIQSSIKSKPFPPSYFRLNIDGLPTTHVRLIAPISFRRTSGGIAPSDLVVTFSGADVGPWRAWADDFIVKGNNGQGKEKHGSIEVMAPNLSGVLATLTVRQIGIRELVPLDHTSALPGYRAGMYFEFGQLSYH
jgi:hypothetical protein